MSIISSINSATGAFSSPALADNIPDAAEYGLLPEAYARYLAVADEATAAPGEIAALTAAADEVRDDLVWDNRTVERLTFEHPNNPGPQAAEIQAARPAKEANLKRLRDAASQARKRSAAMQKVHVANARYARANAGRLTPAAAITPPKNATVDGCQEQRKGFLAKRNDVDGGLIPFEDARRQVLDAVLKIKQGPQLAKPRAGKPPKITWPFEAYPSVPMAGGIFTVTDAVAIACWLNPEKVIDDLTEQLRQQYEGQTGLTAKEKATQLAAIDAEILQVERIEAEIVWRQRAQGIPTPFRATIDPRACLQVNGPAPSEPEIA